MKNNLFAIFCCLSFIGVSQLKVDQYGRIGMGTNYPNPGYKCHITGDLLLTTWPASDFRELRMKLYTSGIRVRIGSNDDQIAFWSEGYNYNKVYAESYTSVSDIRLKKNIESIDGGIMKIMTLRPVIYTPINEDEIRIEIKNESDKVIRKYGFISQEIEKALPDVKITTDAMDIKLMEYDQLIPLVVSAIQEQQEVIDSLRNELERINKFLAINNRIESNVTNNRLGYNVPNPFTHSTSINYLVDELNFDSAGISIFDLNGKLIHNYIIKEPGEGLLNVGIDKLGGSGMYMYTLIVNGKEIDTKRMIVTY